MFTRRTFLSLIVSAVPFSDRLFDRFLASAEKRSAQTSKRLVPPGTKLETLIDENPADLDSSLLDITPLDQFGVMGLEDHETNMDEWRLLVDGNVENPLSLDYSQVKALPWIKEPALLICRGIFASNGSWKGVAAGELLRLAQPRPDATHILIQGPQGNYEKVEKFPLSDALSRRFLFAYEVNGEVLPRRNGFPLRLVAEGFYGDQWIKYVYKVSVT